MPPTRARGASRHRRIGILGGMGPAATVDLYAKLIEETPARDDQEHLPVLVWGDPGVPDRSAHLTDGGPDPRPWLQAGLTELAAAGCEVLAVPCNTAHVFVRDLAASSPLELVDLIEVTADHLATRGHRTVGLLATTGTVHSGIYDEALRRRSIATVHPGTAEQAIVTSAIAAVKADQNTESHRAALDSVTNALKTRGADAVVAGCTELVLALGEETRGGVPIVDPARLLARRLVTTAYRPAPGEGESMGTMELEGPLQGCVT